MCKLFGISRQGYYQRLRRNEHELSVKQQIVKQVKKVQKRHKRMGGKKLYNKLQTRLKEIGIKYGRDKFFDVLSQENLLVKYPNLIHDLDITRAEQVFVSDITYIRTKKGFPDLFLITDAYFKQIMDWLLSDNMKTINAVRALRMGIKNRGYPHMELIHHSDRGLQYCNPSYIEVLEKNNKGISMTTKYDPYENAVAERVNSILKSEYDIGEGFVGYKDTKAEINFAI